MMARVNENVHQTQAVCVTPSRELAIYLQGIALKAATYSGISVACTEVSHNKGSSVKQQQTKKCR